MQFQTLRNNLYEPMFLCQQIKVVLFLNVHDYWNCYTKYNAAIYVTVMSFVQELFRFQRKQKSLESNRNRNCTQKKKK